MFFDTPLYNRLFSGNNREMCASSNPIDRSKGASAGIYRTLRFLLVPTDAVRAPLHFHPVGSSRIPVTSFSFQGWANTSIHLGRRRFFRVESGGGGEDFFVEGKRWTLKREGAVEEWEGRQLISSSCFFLIGGWGWKVKPEKKGGGKRKKEIAEGPDRVVVVAQSVTHKRRTTLPPLRRCTHTHTCIQRIRQVRAGAAGWYRCSTPPPPPLPKLLFCSSSFSAVQSTVWAVARKPDSAVRAATPVASSKKLRKTPSSKTCVTRRAIAITPVSSWTTAAQITARHAEVVQPFICPIVQFLVVFIDVRNSLGKSGPQRQSGLKTLPPLNNFRQRKCRLLLPVISCARWVKRRNVVGFTQKIVDLNFFVGVGGGGGGGY